MKLDSFLYQTPRFRERVARRHTTGNVANVGRVSVAMLEDDDRVPHQFFRSASTKSNDVASVHW
jgi:hypothetical protein